jgi:hypothetical protein
VRFDLHLRRSMLDRVSEVSAQMAAWDRSDTISPDTHRRLVEAIQPFDHATSEHGLVIGGVDGSGDFPALAYSDSFVYLTVASAALYKADSVSGLREIALGIEPLIEYTWLTTSSGQRRSALIDSFERLVGLPIEEVVERSDYGALGRGSRPLVSDVLRGLIVPPAHDAGNIGTQLRTTAELAAALKIIEVVDAGAIVVNDGTMSLPLVHRQGASLFFEHLRRLCCVEACDRGVTYISLSKSAGLAAGAQLEEAARERLGTAEPEHWFMRVPDPSEGWSPYPPDGPQVPPAGAVSYLVRLHRSTPVMRVDINAHAWPSLPEERAEHETRLFASLDYASHDQRCYGYPYPVKAAHDRGSLTEAERVVLRQQVIDAAVAAGMRRTRFRDPSQLTGHG